VTLWQETIFVSTPSINNGKTTIQTRTTKKGRQKKQKGKRKL
jgi:hypothetical protein